MTRMSGESRRAATMAAVALVVLQTHGQAGPIRSSSNSELLLADVGPRVTTASRTSQRLEESPASVTVITDREIAQSAALSIPDLLRSVPGVDVDEPNRTMQSVSVRGFNDPYSSRLLILVDGRPMFQDVFGPSVWNTTPLLLSRVKRIEVVRGPGSALYGAVAVNGVINIILKTPEELAASEKKTRISLNGGDHGAQTSETLVSDAFGRGWSFSVGSAYNRTSGFGERRPGAVRDSFTAPILTFDLQKRAGRGSIQLSAGSAGATSDVSTVFFAEDADWRTRFATFAYTEDGARNPVQVRAFTNTLKASWQLPVTLVDSRASQMEVQQEHALGPRHTMVYGASYRDTSAVIFAAGPDRHSQAMRSLFAQDAYRLAPRTLLYTGLRYDTHSDYGDHLTPRVSLVRQAGDGGTARLSYGTAFRFPALLDEYYNVMFEAAPGLIQTVTSSPTLGPEQIESWELSYRRAHATGYWELNLYRNRATDVIGWYPRHLLSGPLPFADDVVRANICDASAWGVELDTRWPVVPGLTGMLNYSFQDVHDSNGQAMNLSPRHKLNVGLMLDTRKGLFGSCVAHFVDSSTLQDSGPALPIPSYIRLDARLGWRLPGAMRGWSVSVAGANLLNNAHREYPILYPGSPQNASTEIPRTLWLSLNGRM